MSDLSFLKKLLDRTDVEWKPLGELGELVRGNGLPKSDFTETGVPAIHYGQIYTYYGLFTHTTISFVSPETAATLKQVETGDVVITNTSENFEDVGTPLVYLGQEIAVTGGHATIFKPNGSILGMYFAYFTQTPSFVSAKRKFARGAKVIDLSAKDMAKIEIPIPCPEEPQKSLAIQGEIVRILDSFTDLTSKLTAELTTELEARKKKYNHYRDQILTFEDSDVPWKTLDELCDFQNAKPHEKVVVPDGDITLMTSRFISTQGKSARYVRRRDVLTPAYAEDVALVMSDLPNGRALAKAFFVRENDRYAANQRVCLLRVKDKKEFSPRFLFYVVDRNPQLLAYDNGYDQTHLKKGWILDVNLPVPALAEQERIVAILDKFDTLITSLNEDLPREIALRQQQYEYYRNLLLSFPKPAEPPQP